jgi:hypothetical protein
MGPLRALCKETLLVHGFGRLRIAIIALLDSPLRWLANQAEGHRGGPVLPVDL